MPEAPAEQDQPTNAPEAPETDQPTGGEEESFTDSYNPDELPEEARGAYEEAYKRLQGAYTQKTQSLAEERREIERAQQLQQALRNPQVAPAVLAQLGYDEKKVLEMYGYQPEEEEDPNEFADPDVRIDRLEQTLAQRETAEQQARQEEAIADYITDEIVAVEERIDRELPQGAHKFLDAFARQHPKELPGGQLAPDVEGAFAVWESSSSEEQKRWIESKKTPRPPGGGKPGSRTVDLSKESEEDFVKRQQAAIDQARASAQ